MWRLEIGWCWWCETDARFFFALFMQNFRDVIMWVSMILTFFFSFKFKILHSIMFLLCFSWCVVAGLTVCYIYVFFKFVMHFCQEKVCWNRIALSFVGFKGLSCFMLIKIKKLLRFSSVHLEDVYVFSHSHEIGLHLSASSICSSDFNIKLKN